VESDPRRPDAWVLKAEARFRAGRNQRGALEDLGKALALEPAHPGALALRAHVALRRDVSGRVLAGQDLGPPRQDARLALRLGATGLAQLTVAELAWSEGDLAAAGEAVAKALETPGGHRALALLLRAQLAYQAGQLDAAFADLQAVLATQPGSPLAVSLTGRILAQRGQLAYAKAWLDQALKLDESNYEARLARARLGLDDRPRRLEQALADASAAAELQPQAAEPRLLRGVALHGQGEQQRALEALAEFAERAGRKGPPAWEGQRWRGHCHYALGQWAEAKQAYQAYLEAAPAEGREERCARRLERCRRHLGELPRVY
jgi:tetratricopeptide (TPR) repeat protein